MQVTECYRKQTQVKSEENLTEFSHIVLICLSFPEKNLRLHYRFQTDMQVTLCYRKEAK
jgi:hypothetical protein